MLYMHLQADKSRQHKNEIEKVLNKKDQSPNKKRIYKRIYENP